MAESGFVSSPGNYSHALAVSSFLSVQGASSEVARVKNSLLDMIRSHQILVMQYGAARCFPRLHYT